jgi:hypothetical protein
VLRLRYSKYSLLDREVSGDRQRSGRAGPEAQRRAIAAACRRQRWQLLELVEGDRPLGRGGEAPRGSRSRCRCSRPLTNRRSSPPSATGSRACCSTSPAWVATAHQQGRALVALDCALEPTPTAEANANLLATLAPFERQPISQRTRVALAATRARSVRLGRPPTISQHAIDQIRREQTAGKSLAAIANRPNADRIPTAQGALRWYPATIRYTLNRTTSPPTPSQSAGGATPRTQPWSSSTLSSERCAISDAISSADAPRLAHHERTASFCRRCRRCQAAPAQTRSIRRRCKGLPSRSRQAVLVFPVTHGHCWTGSGIGGRRPEASGPKVRRPGDAFVRPAWERSGFSLAAVPVQPPGWVST